ncbi:UNVERIFIED_CONTAM: hypothetical protein Slati_3706000 [Sesamum latifolium]|uniref:Reverse transcriptase Ty1/copia-type domain-containing protein n=1 Tax=Sesamum latifolium TaxID=2727402 RepID=A0AAW2U2D8_9LAMI
MAKSIRILLSIAVWNDYEIWQMDVKMAFLSGFIEEETFMDQLEVTLGYDFIKNEHDPCVYKKISGSSVAYLVLYVDDILLIVKTILKYLKRTKDMFLIYGGGELIQEGYNDASFQSGDDDAKSQSASEAAKEAIWMKSYIQELGMVPSIAEPIVIFCDNNGAIAQAKEQRSHHRFKHILRRYHLLREMVSRSDVRMDRVSSV